MVHKRTRSRNQRHAQKRKPLKRIVMGFAMIWAILVLLAFTLFQFRETAAGDFIRSALVVNILLLLLSFVVCIFVILFYVVKTSITDYLWNPNNFFVLAESYLLVVILIITLMTVSYAMIESFGKGYLTYGKCSDRWSDALMGSDPAAVQSWQGLVYFSTGTFFTVGYGEICPQGWTKIVAMLNMLLGNFFTVGIMAIAITRYHDLRMTQGKGK